MPTETYLVLLILGGGVTLLTWWLRRKADPLQQNRERYEQIDQDIQKHDSLTATTHATDDLDELERLQDANNQQRPS